MVGKREPTQREPSGVFLLNFSSVVDSQENLTKGESHRANRCWRVGHFNSGTAHKGGERVGAFTGPTILQLAIGPISKWVKTL